MSNQDTVGQHTAEQLVQRVAQIAGAVGWQAGVSATELAGQIISVLAANPEHIDRFMAEGGELFIDGTIRAENGCLTYVAQNGSLMSASDLRAVLGLQQ